VSRGFDGFEIDDFRDSDSGWGRDADRDRSSDWTIGLLFTTSIVKKADRRVRTGSYPSKACSASEGG